jgi:rare lipoprotein A
MQSELQAFLQVPVFVNEVDASGKRLYRVRVGPVADATQMNLVQQQLADSGYPAGQPLP